MKKAIISGCSGQLGSHLADLLLEKGYEVHGIVRRSSTANLGRIRHLEGKLKLHSADLGDQGSLSAVVTEVKPDEVYNLAAQSFVAASWNQPVLTGDLTGLGVTRMLEAVRHSWPCARFYNAGSSEAFGRVLETPQSETTPFYPRSPYGCAKSYAHSITRNYRESFGLFASTGICFNAEGPRRGMEFVTQKIAHAVAAISQGRQKELVLGNLDAKRDWGFAGEYVTAMHAIMQLEKPDDFVIATGQTHSVKDFCRAAFNHVELDWGDYVRTDPAFLRPAEVDLLVGNPTKLRLATGWKAEIRFEQLVKMMVDAALKAH